MTDLAMTRLCAEAMGYFWEQWSHVNAPVTGLAVRVKDGGEYSNFDPLNDDGQAMALVKRFHLHIGKTLRTPEEPFGRWVVSKTSKADAVNTDLNCAIVECVAKMQAAKAKS